MGCFYELSWWVFVMEKWWKVHYIDDRGSGDLATQDEKLVNQWLDECKSGNPGDTVKIELFYENPKMLPYNSEPAEILWEDSVALKLKTHDGWRNVYFTRTMVQKLSALAYSDVDKNYEDVVEAIVKTPAEESMGKWEFDDEENENDDNAPIIFTYQYGWDSRSLVKIGDDVEESSLLFSLEFELMTPFGKNKSEKITISYFETDSRKLVGEFYLSSWGRRSKKAYWVSSSNKFPPFLSDILLKIEKDGGIVTNKAKKFIIPTNIKDCFMNYRGGVL